MTSQGYKKSVQWFWRRNRLKEKFMDRRRTDSTWSLYSSLEASVQVS